MKKSLNIIIIILIISIIGVSIYYFLFANDKKNPSRINFAEKSISIYVNESKNLVIRTSNDISKSSLIWESDNEKIVSVNNEGVITGNEIGSTTVRVHTSDNKVSDICVVNVSKKNIESITLNKNNVELEIGELIQLQATIMPSELSNEKITWVSDDDSIASVDSNGTITGINSGETIIRALADNIEVQCTVKVIAKVIPTISPTISPTSSPIILPTPTPTLVPTPIPTLVPTPIPTPTPSKLEIHFINAGGFYDDAILIRSDKTTIFIDGGRGKEAVVKYLNELKITTIDYVIGSHTEYDHIDAQGEVIKQFDVKNVIYPNSISKCGCRCENTDVRSVLAALKSKGMTEQVQPIPSKIITEDLGLYFIAPRKLICNKNENSFIFIMTYGNNTFMFTGDASSAPTNKDYVDTMISYAQSLGLSNIHADVLKYPHHGNQSLGDYFLDSVTPSYVIVPNVHASTTPKSAQRDKLKARNIQMFRQCDSSTGNIVLTSDGNNINIIMDAEAINYAK